MEKIYLASASPRRKELLSQINLNFEILVPEVKEINDNTLAPEEVVKLNSEIKALAVSKQVDKNSIIIAADTIVVFDNIILGKPKDKNDAIHTLKLLSGKKHKVITGVTLIFNNLSKIETNFVESYVYFKNMTNDEIMYYVESGEPMDKAGSYGIQGLGAIFIEKIEGDYNNIVGLPISLIYDILKKYNIDIIKH